MAEALKAPTFGGPHRTHRRRRGGGTAAPARLGGTVQRGVLLLLQLLLSQLSDADGDVVEQLGSQLLRART